MPSIVAALNPLWPNTARAARRIRSRLASRFSARPEGDQPPGCPGMEVDQVGVLASIRRDYDPVRTGERTAPAGEAHGSENPCKYALPGSDNAATRAPDSALPAQSLPNPNGIGQTKNAAFAGVFDAARADLNRGPHRPVRRALPGCATPRNGQYCTAR